MTHSSMPSRRETTGKYWNFKPFLGLKHLQQFHLPQWIAFRFVALFVLGNATATPSGAGAMTLFDSPLTSGLSLPRATAFAGAERQPNKAKCSALRRLHNRGPLDSIADLFSHLHRALDSFPASSRLRDFARNFSPVPFLSPGRQASCASCFSPPIHHSRLCSGARTNQTQLLDGLNTAAPRENVSWRVRSYLCYKIMRLSGCAAHGALCPRLTRVSGGGQASPGPEHAASESSRSDMNASVFTERSAPRGGRHRCRLAHITKVGELCLDT
jgi:hypothetical protein